MECRSVEGIGQEQLVDGLVGTEHWLNKYSWYRSGGLEYSWCRNGGLEYAWCRNIHPE